MFHSKLHTDVLSVLSGEQNIPTRFKTRSPLRDRMQFSLRVHSSLSLSLSLSVSVSSISFTSGNRAAISASASPLSPFTLPLPSPPAQLRMEEPSLLLCQLVLLSLSHSHTHTLSQSEVLSLNAQRLKEAPSISAWLDLTIPSGHPCIIYPVIIPAEQGALLFLSILYFLFPPPLPLHVAPSAAPFHIHTDKTIPK